MPGELRTIACPLCGEDVWWDDSPVTWCARCVDSDRPTVHALAVLGARVLAKLVETNGSMDLDIPAAVDAVGLADPESDDWTYATPQIAATVAALTRGDM